MDFFKHRIRAVCGRLVGTLEELSPPFRLSRPLVAQSSSAEQRNAMRAPSFSVNWTKGQPAQEVINAVTGKTEVGRPSRLCKQNMFKRWLRLVPSLTPLPQPNAKCVFDENFNSSLSSLGYDFAKSKAVLYQNSKLCLFKAFQKANLGSWLKKPLEQDQFHKIDGEI